MTAKPKRILVYGGRNYGHVVRTVGNPDDEPPTTQERLAEYKLIHRALNKLTLEYSDLFNPRDNWLPTDIIIIEGGATGADSAAYDFAVCSFCQVEEYAADWKTHGKAAGPIRNQQMIDIGKPDIAVEFPGGKGTADMRSRLDKAGIKVLDGTKV